MPIAPIPENHPQISVEGETFDLSHLDTFNVALAGKGIDGGDIPIKVVFSTHVFTERATHGRRRDIQDQSGTWRTFCADRYGVSLVLADTIKRFIEHNERTTVSQDFNKGANLLIVETHDRKNWAVFFCFEPDEPGLRLSVLSVYAQTGNLGRHAKYNHASYYARKCLYSGERVP